MITFLPILAAAGAALAASLVSGPGRVGLTSRAEKVVVAEEEALLLRLRPVLAVLAFVGGWAFVGGVVGLALGVAAALTAWTVLGRTESPATRRRRLALQRDLPTGVDLLGCCLTAGGAPEAALVIVADALGGPVAEELRLIHHRLSLGLDPTTVWRDVGRHAQLGPLGRSVSRAHETGASITDAIHRLADELRALARADVEARAKSVEVKAAAPLGICFLPAFVLLGVVPLVAGIFLSMSLFS